ANPDRRGRDTRIGKPVLVGNRIIGSASSTSTAIIGGRTVGPSRSSSDALHPVMVRVKPRLGGIGLIGPRGSRNEVRVQDRDNDELALVELLDEVPAPVPAVRLLAVYDNPGRADVMLNDISTVPLGFRYHQSVQYGIMRLEAMLAVETAPLAGL